MYGSESDTESDTTSIATNTTEDMQRELRRLGDDASGSDEENSELSCVYCFSFPLSSSLALIHHTHTHAAIAIHSPNAHMPTAVQGSLLFH